jgi:hypothetical protein
VAGTLNARVTIPKGSRAMPLSATAPLCLALAAALISTASVVAAVIRQSRMVALRAPARPAPRGLHSVRSPRA